MVELERDGATGEGEQGGIRVGDIVRVAEQPRGSERKRERVGMEGRGVEGVVVRRKLVGLEVAVAGGQEQRGGDGDGDGEGVEGLGGRLWV